MEKPGDDSAQDSATPLTEAPKKRGRKKGSIGRKAAKSKKSPDRTRTHRPFPASSFEEALEFAKGMLAFGAGQPVRRLTLFDHLGKSPESGPSRQLITNANKYGLISGSYKADQLELTPDGIKAADETLPPRELARARAKLAIEDIPPFKELYQTLIGNKLPAKAALIDSIQRFDVSSDAAEEGVDTFIVNLRFVGLLRTLSGAERIVPIDHLLDALPASQSNTPSQTSIKTTAGAATQPATDFDKTCFYVTPIGSEGSEERKHSDLFMGSLIEPALEAFGLKVVRADG